MLRLYCPHCGESRSEEEFHYKGQAHLVRPQDPDAATDLEWAEYLFFRPNPRGLHQEMWYHAGCRKFLNCVRDTVSYRVLETYPIGRQPTQAVTAAGSLRPAAPFSRAVGASAATRSVDDTTHGTTDESIDGAGS